MFLFLLDSCICVSSRTKTRIIGMSEYFVLIICSSLYGFWSNWAHLRFLSAWNSGVFFCAGLLLVTIVNRFEGVLIGLSGSSTLTLKLWKCVFWYSIENGSVSSRLHHTSWQHSWHFHQLKSAHFGWLFFYNLPLFYNNIVLRKVPRKFRPWQ